MIDQKCVFKIPEGETGTLVFNSVDRPKVLRVKDQDGVTTGEPLKSGKAKLTFKVGRKTRTVNVTVCDPKEVKKITIIDKATGKKPKDNKRTLYHNEGKTINLTQFLVFTPTMEGSTEVCTDVIWTSKKPKVVSVDEHGVAQAVGKPGTATIVVESAYPGNSRKVKQTIIIKVK